MTFCLWCTVRTIYINHTSIVMKLSTWYYIGIHAIIHVHAWIAYQSIQCKKKKKQKNQIVHTHCEQRTYKSNSCTHMQLYLQVICAASTCVSKIVTVHQAIIIITNNTTIWLNLLAPIVIFVYDMIIWFQLRTRTGIFILFCLFTL